MADFLEYEYLIRTAAKQTDSGKRIAYLIGFLYILYSTLPVRLKKPFNPLLGETYEWIENDI